MNGPQTTEIPEQRRSIRSALARRFGAGFLVLMPSAVALWFAAVLFSVISGLLRPLVRAFPAELPELAERLVALGLLVLLVYLVGLFAANYVGRRVIRATESLVARIPLARTVYATARNVMDVLSASQRQAFQRVVLLEYPKAGMMAIGFVTGTMQVNGARYVKVFVPTTPNPTSGFLELVREGDAQETNLTVEAAVKLIVSGGIVSPDSVELTGVTDAARDEQGKE